MNVLLAPRVVPVQSIKSAQTVHNHSEVSEALPVHHVSIKIISFSKQDLVYGILASVVNEKSTTLERNQLVVGLVEGPVDEFMVVDSATLFSVPADFAKHARTAPVLAIGFVSAILASGLGAFSRPQCLKSA